MKMKSFIYLLTIFILLTSCKNYDSKESGNDSTITLSISKESIIDSLLYTDIFDSATYIKLENTDESLISTVDRIEVTDDRIYVLSSFRDRAVFVFNKNGKFIFKINNVGRGPGEFIRPVDFFVDNKNKNILIYSSYPSRLIKYDYHGKFITETKLEVRSMGGFTIFDNILYIYTCHSSIPGHDELNYEIFKTNMKGEILGKYLPYNNSNRGYPNCITISPGSSNIFNNGKYAVFSMLYCDTIYSITHEKFTPKYFIDFNEYTLPPDFIKNHLNNKKMLSSKISDSPYANMLRHTLENDKILYFEFRLKNRIYSTFYKKRENELIVPKRFYDNMCFFEPEFISIYKNNLVGIKNPNFLISHIKNEISRLNKNEQKILIQNPNFKKTQSLLNSITEDDNPVVVLLKLKNNI